MTKINDNSEITIPVRNLIAIIFFTSVSTIAYFGVLERLNLMENNFDILELGVESNSEFRIRWPRGELGSLPDDAEQNMRLTYIERELEKIKEILD
tara:strand:- start:156 stop:443 length:288 start_codon:yes stop_codon:yes gene_type:complete